MSHKSRTYSLTIQGGDEDECERGDLDVTRGNLLIIARGSNAIIDASALGDRVFHVLPKAKLTLVNVTIKGGTPPAQYGEYSENGGGILNQGSLVIRGCAFIGNRASDGGVRSPGGDIGGDGGGIYNDGALTVSDSMFLSNTAGDGTEAAPGGSGGALVNAGTCVLQRCRFLNNRCGDGGLAEATTGFAGSGGSGGAIWNSGRLAVVGCDISLNRCGLSAAGNQPGNAYGNLNPGAPGPNGGEGGAVYNIGFARISTTSVYSNSAANGGDGGSANNGGKGGHGGAGGGIFNDGSLALTLSTVSGNSAGNGGAGGRGAPHGGGDGGSGGSGGGVYNGGLMNVKACTITANMSGAGGPGGGGESEKTNEVTTAGWGGDGGSGGGVYCDSLGTNQITATIVAYNTAGAGGKGAEQLLDHPVHDADLPYIPPSIVPEPDGEPGIGNHHYGVFTSRGFNLIESCDGSTGITNGMNSDIAGTTAAPVDPLLGPLQMNGGITPTQALLPGSPAIDQGDSFGLKTDQRGHKRPQKFPHTQPAPGGDGSDIGAYELDAQ
jgi:hypothetical protein